MNTENQIYNKGKKIAEQILNVMFMQSDKDSSDLKEWITDNPVAQETKNILSDPELLQEELKQFSHAEKYQKAEVLVEKIRKRQVRKRIVRYSTVAASVLLAVFGVLSIERSESPQAVVEGIQGPLLILADGKRLDLSTMQSNMEINNGVYIHSDSNNGLAYATKSSPADHAQMNRLLIPRQCTYRVTLGDGSVIHLNAESELLYPEKFIGNEREVILKGEAYFEVKQDSRPFIVQAGKARIRVYGTKFNINAYSRDWIETVLVEGKVGVSIAGEANRECVLHPNQLSHLNLLNGKQAVNSVAVGKYISWISGILQYEGDALEKVMEDLSRWYGIQLNIDHPMLQKLKVTASINKDLSFTEVISMMETTLDIQFLKKEGGYLIVFK